MKTATTKEAALAALARLTWTGHQPAPGTTDHEQLVAVVSILLERGDDVTSATVREHLGAIADWTRSSEQERTCRDLVSRLA